MAGARKVIQGVAVRNIADARGQKTSQAGVVVAAEVEQGSGAGIGDVEGGCRGGAVNYAPRRDARRGWSSSQVRHGGERREFPDASSDGVSMGERGRCEQNCYTG